MMRLEIDCMTNMTFSNSKAPSLNIVLYTNVVILTFNN